MLEQTTQLDEYQVSAEGKITIVVESEIPFQKLSAEEHPPASTWVWGGRVLAEGLCTQEPLAKTASAPPRACGSWPKFGDGRLWSEQHSGICEATDLGKP